MRRRAQAAPEVGIDGRDWHRERVGDRDEQVGGHVLEPPLDLREVGGRASRLAGDLAEPASLTLAMRAEDAAELPADLVSGYAQSRIHNAQSISPAVCRRATFQRSDGVQVSLAEQWQPFS